MTRHLLIESPSQPDVYDMPSVRRVLRAVLIAGLWSALALPNVAEATVTATYVAPTLTVVSDSAGDVIAISCSGGNVEVGGITVIGGPAPCTLATVLSVIAGAGDDTMDLSGLAQFLSGSSAVDGGSGNDTLVWGSLGGFWDITGPNQGSAPINFSAVENLTGGPIDEVFFVTALPGVDGVIDGGGGSNSLSYCCNPAAVNLGANVPALIASLDGGQEVPRQLTEASGVATLVLDVSTKLFDVSVTVSGVAPELVSGFHIHRAVTGVNGAVIVDFMPGGNPIAPLMSFGTGFTFTATNVSLPALQEASLLGGVTYLNVQTQQFPNGEIRGQLIPSGSFSPTPGTASGTGGIRNIQRVTGSAFDDSLVGSLDANALFGQAGVDTILGLAGSDVVSGGPGDDTVSGGLGDDTLFTQFSDEGLDTWIETLDADIPQAIGADISPLTQLVVFSGGPGNNTIDMSNFAGFPFSLLSFRVNGEGGDDVLIGAGGGVNALIGGRGNDIIVARANGHTTADGGDGFDVLRVIAVGATVVGNAVLINGVERVIFFDIEDIELQAGATEPPNITVTTPTSAGSTTASSPFLRIGGIASDDLAVTRVTWSTNHGAAGAAIGTTSWTAEVPVIGGTTVITVTAEDAQGNQGFDTLNTETTVFRYLLAEGATGPFFDLDLALANPNATEAPTTITYLKEDGTTFAESFTLAAHSRRTVSVDNSLAQAIAVSSIVESTGALPLLVERSMFWDTNYYGSHTGNAVDAPSMTWYFGEGSQGFFDTYILLANRDAASANVEITFLPESGAPVMRNFLVGPTSRLNVFVGEIPELQDRSFAVFVQSTAPIIAERAMYFGATRIWDGGHESAGVPAPSTSWFHAEGATGDFFDTYILVGNPNPTPANVVLTFLLDTGQTVIKPFTIAANNRLTVNIEEQDALLANVAVSTTVSSDVPVISERAMYWPGNGDSWFEAHNTFGVTTTATKWGLAEGRVGGAQQFETYFLLANPDPVQTAMVNVTFLRANGTTVTKNYAVGPSTRFNVHANGMVPELTDEHFGALIEVTNSVPIVVERAMYSNAFGVTWAAGTNALATRLP